MNKTKRTRLEARGWGVGSAKDFLGLSPEESALVETRLALSQALRSKRIAHGLTQGELARRLKSSQSRVAKMEAGDKTVSVDLLVRALFSLGAKPRDIGRALQRRHTAAA
jgi:ribosome-binding protein aMBF1 (putative translation factor)